MLWASAYGGLVLGLARRAGVAVPQEEFGRVMDYLSQQLRSIGDDSTLSDYCLALYALAVANRAEPAYQERLYAFREKLCREERALLALAILEGHGPKAMAGELLKATPGERHEKVYRFGCPARESAIRLLAWAHYQPADPMVDVLVNDLMNEQKQAHWGTTQGNAWAMLALTDYARRIEGKLQPIEGRLSWEGQTIPFQLNDRTNVFTRSFSLTNSADTPLVLVNELTNRLFATTCLDVRPPVSHQPRQDRGFNLARRYDRLDDDNRPQDLKSLRVGDRVLVTLRLAVREQARFVVIDDALPSILEIVNPEFQTQQARGEPQELFGEEGDWWRADFRELRKDRFLSFANWVAPGNYTLRYIARVRAAGTVTAPCAKVEEMYHPERYGLSETQPISSQPWE